MSILDQIAQAVLDGDEQAAPRLVQQAIDQALPAQEILQAGLLKGMNEVGRRFREGEYFIPEVLVAAEAMKAGAAVLKPHLVRAGVRPQWTAVIGTVQGDLHDIGKNLVATMLEGAGFEVLDLGVDVPPEKFVDVCRQRSVHVVGLSALLTTTMPMMETTITRLKESLDRPPPVIVGGAPVSQAFANKIGAAGYGPDAATGAEIAKQLCLAGRP